MSQEPTFQQDSPVAWRDLIDVSDIDDPDIKAKTIAALEKIEQSETGQLVLKSIEAKLASPEHGEGLFRNEKIMMTDKPTIFGETNIATHFYDEGTLDISLDPERVDGLRFATPDGEVFRPSFDSVVIHELAHIADGGAVDNHLERKQIKDKIEQIETKQQTIADDIYYYPDSDVVQQAPPDTRDALVERVALQRKADNAFYGDGEKLTEKEVERLGELNVIAESFLSSLPEYTQYNEDVAELKARDDVLFLEAEVFPVATANTYRIEQGLNDSVPKDQIGQRGHYEASFHVIENGGAMTTAEQALEFREKNAQWLKENGTPPKSIEEYKERYGDRLLQREDVGRELQQERDGKPGDAPIPENPGLLKSDASIDMLLANEGVERSGFETSEAEAGNKHPTSAPNLVTERDISSIRNA